MTNESGAELRDGLIGFNGEAMLYCQSISDAVAQEYARDYARMLVNRAKGMEFVLPRISRELFEPNRNLIKSTLNRMFDKYFPAK